jgi:hypothetical protein
MSTIQLGGNLQLGPVGGPLVDYSDYISQMIITTTREGINTPPTLGKPRGSVRPGAISETLEIQFHSDMAATSVWAELWDAIYTDDAELDFAGNLEEGATSVSNPHFVGTIVVMALNTGGQVGQLRQQSQTWPVTEDGVTKTTA